jgi:carbon storage regulator CsrA
MTLRRKAMLILSQKVGEKIIIGEDIHVTVVNVDRSRVFLLMSRLPMILIRPENTAVPAKFA